MPRGVFTRTVEYREKLRQAMFRRVNPGKNKSEETKKKIGDAARGRKMSQKNIEKQRERMKGIAFFKGKKHKKSSIDLIKAMNSKENHYNWKGGIAIGDNKTKRAVELRRIRNGFPEGRFEILIEEQDNKCSICGIDLASGLGKNSACADHCHKTIKHRGILCKACNSMLGHANDDIEILARAIEYLEYWRKVNG